MCDATQILEEIQAGDPTAAERLLPLVYDELRRLAEARMVREHPGQTLQATGLVHEAYLRLVTPKSVDWRGRHHFFAAAAEAMRRILIEQARRKKAIRHGGEFTRVNLDEGAILSDEQNDELLELNDALERLEQLNASRAEIVKLRYFTGLTVPEAASAMGISVTTAERYWRFARAWLLADMSDPPRPQSQDEEAE